MIEVRVIALHCSFKMNKKNVMRRKSSGLVDESGRWPGKVVTTLEPFLSSGSVEDYH